MAGKSDPSIYNERTSIGSSDDLDEYGVWVKTEPQDLSSSLPDIEELPDFDSESGGDAPEMENISIEELDIPDLADDETIPDDISLGSEEIEFEEIPEELDLPEGEAISGIDADGFTEVSMDDFLDISDIDSPESIDFGNLDSSVPEIEMFEQSESDVPSASAPPPSAGRHAFSDDLSTQLLQKIADELSSIKKEISSLKKELSVVRGEVKVQESAEPAGFFDEEDDEKIALTGDELDNILNTANFTEETGSGEGVENSFSSEPISQEAVPEQAPPPDPAVEDEPVTEDEPGASIEINFDEELSDLEGAVSPGDDITIPDADDFDIALDLTPELREDSTELNALREEGALPITEMPEDTSYLDEAIDFSEAVIDEPDLSESITENPVSEPVIDNISIDLDMEEMETPEENPEVTAEILGPDDFVFETEETLELPAGEFPELDDEFPPLENVDDNPVDDILPAISDDVDFLEIDNSDADTPKAALSPASSGLGEGIPNNLKQELKTVLSYMDQLLESLPEDKIEEFAKSEYFETYKKLFEELGLV